jgi:putative hydrolase of the HAD superfamily
MIKTLIFDLGKVIVPFDHDIGLQILEKNCAFSREDMRRKIFASKELELYQSGVISSDEFFIAIKTILDLQISYSLFVKIWNSSFTFTPIIDEKIIVGLSRKFRMLILSDTNEIHFEFIKTKFPVLRHFDDFILSYKVGVLKPSEKIFRLAVEKAGCRAEECFFTDDIKINVEGAKKIGIHAFQFVSAYQFQKDIDKLLAEEEQKIIF